MDIALNCNRACVLTGKCILFLKILISFHFEIVYHLNMKTIDILLNIHCYYVLILHDNYPFQSYLISLHITLFVFLILSCHSTFEPWTLLRCIQTKMTQFVPLFTIYLFFFLCIFVTFYQPTDQWYQIIIYSHHVHFCTIKCC